MVLSLIPAGLGLFLHDAWVFFVSQVEGAQKSLQRLKFHPGVPIYSLQLHT